MLILAQHHKLLYFFVLCLNKKAGCTHWSQYWGQSWLMFAVLFCRASTHWGYVDDSSVHSLKILLKHAWSIMKKYLKYLHTWSKTDNKRLLSNVGSNNKNIETNIGPKAIFLDHTLAKYCWVQCWP